MRALTLRSVCVAALAGLPLIVALGPALAACGGTPAVDANEPNNGPEAATTLTPGKPLDGVLTAGDSDVFGSEAPAGAGDHPFVVTLTCDDPASLKMDVGASIPGVWEGITWPGWEPVASGDRLEVTGSLRKGTVLVFLHGDAEVAYTIAVTWR